MPGGLDWHRKGAGIHYWQAAEGLRALLTYYGKGADIHFWQAAELAINGRRLKKIVKKDGGFGGCIRLLSLLAS